MLYPGRLGREKGVFELVEASELSREPWRLHLVGMGPAERVLLALASQRRERRGMPHGALRRVGGRPRELCDLERMCAG